MNRDVQKFNSLVQETLVMSGENDEDWLTRVQILFKTHAGSELKHKSAWLFLKDRHKWKNSESTLARRNRLRVTDEEPEHFGEDVLPRPPGVQRIAKSQRSSNSTASSGSNPTMFQEMMQQQYELDRKTKDVKDNQEGTLPKVTNYRLYNSTKYHTTHMLVKRSLLDDPLLVANISSLKAVSTLKIQASRNHSDRCDDDADNDDDHGDCDLSKIPS
ncbi:hypothetical protein Tco_0554135 [Tanacetum coccineum]